MQTVALLAELGEFGSALKDARSGVVGGDVGGARDDAAVGFEDLAGGRDEASARERAGGEHERRVERRREIGRAEQAFDDGGRGGVFAADALAERA